MTTIRAAVLAAAALFASAALAHEPVKEGQAQWALVFRSDSARALWVPGTYSDEERCRAAARYALRHARSLPAICVPILTERR